MVSRHVKAISEKVAAKSDEKLWIKHIPTAMIFEWLKYPKERYDFFRISKH